MSKVMASAKQRGPSVVADPLITVGDTDGRHLRIFKRTDGAYIIFDPARKPGDNSVPDDHGKPLLFKTTDDATKAAKSILSKEGGR